MALNERAEHMAYVARDPKCGCNVFVAVDEPNNMKHGTARDIARLMRDGFIIERVTCASIRDGSTPFGCKHRKRNKPGALLL